MASIRISLEQAVPWLNQLTKDMRSAAEKGLVSAGVRLVQEIQTKVIPSEPQMPVDKGIYRAAWRADPIPGGVYVNNTSPQAPFIEYGVQAVNVKPGQAMIDALTEWVKRKGMSARARVASGGGPGVAKTKVPQHEKTDEAVHRLVVKLIGMVRRERVGATTARVIGGKVVLKAQTDTEARSIAWAIAMDMKKRGIFEGKGLRILEKALKNVNTLIKEEIEREISKLK